MKKIFTLLALLTCFIGAKAVEVVDLEIDYTTVTSDAWNGGWRSDDAAARTEIVPGVGIHFFSEEATANLWDAQFQLPGIASGELDSDAAYTITIKIKGTVAQNIHGYFSGGDLPGDIPVTAEEQTLVFEGCQDNPAAQYFASSGSVLIQCGDYVGEWWISYIKITHEAREQRPVTWQEWLTDDGNSIIPGVETESKWVGDAEFGQWPEWSLEKDGDINANWRGDRAPEICAWSLTMGTNFDDQAEAITTDSPRARPYPSDIEAEEGNESNHVFAVHVTQVDVIDAPEPDANSIQWSNQFWIQSPKSWKTGTKVKIKFRCKAEKAATVSTQIHQKNPSIYLHYVGIGDVSITEEWQEIEKTITFDGSQGGGWSLAFNLTANLQEPNVFYFDDLSWQTMVLDEGLFVAASNTKTGIEYDLDNAAEFGDSEEEGVLEATVGTEGKEDTWVNELMISTVRGEDSAFKGGTIKPTGTIVSGEWIGYTDGSNAKIKLPAAGVWNILIDPNTKEICFTQIEGDQIVVKEPVAIVTNETENVVNATERDWRGKDNDGNPIEQEVGEGQPWDNQFWIAANRDLETDEVTVIKFQYKATKAAKTSTQAHKVGDDGKPCTYLNWEAIGDVNFTEEWQDFEKEFKVPAGDNGMRSIVFNMSEIKEANDYYIKNVQWYVKDATLEAEGKTMENLINETGTDNFWIKVNKGAPEQPTAINGVVVNKTAAPAAIYNIAGQRVSKSYKGIVVKDGKKYLVK